MAYFICPECGHEKTVADEHIGKKTKCPKCGQPGLIHNDKSKSIDVVQDYLAGPSLERTKDKLLVIRQSGGSIQTVLSKSIILNENSTLEREFITVIDNSIPAAFTEGVGVTTRYESSSDYESGGYFYASWYSVTAFEDIRAFEVRFLLFNIWGKHVRTLSATEIADVKVGSVRSGDGKWRLFHENEAAEHYASIAFLATVRTASGQVFEADMTPIIQEARKFSSKFIDSDLEPTITPRP